MGNGLLCRMLANYHCSISDSHSYLAFRALGPLEADWGSTRLSIGGPKQRAVLALLLLSADRVVAADTIVEAVWPEDASTGKRRLSEAIARLRASIDPKRDLNVIESLSGGYRVKMAAAGLDIADFKEAVDLAAVQADEEELEKAAVQLRRALKMWRGGVCADVADMFDLGLEPARLEMLREDASMSLLECDLALGSNEIVLADSKAIVSARPFDERVAGLRVLALYRLGRQADALGEVKRLRESLISELGVQPGTDIEELELQVLNHDPRLMRLDPHLSQRVATTLHAGAMPDAGSAVLVDGEHRYELSRPVTTIGRLPDRDVVLDDPLVSRRHCEIRRSGANYRLVDLGSANGTLVNGEPIDSHQLSNGDSLDIGGRRMTFEVE